jgi:hypothetical protein
MTVEKLIKTIQMAKSEIEWNYPMDYTIAFDETTEILQDYDNNCQKLEKIRKDNIRLKLSLAYMVLQFYSWSIPVDKLDNYNFTIKQ